MKKRTYSDIIKELQHQRFLLSRDIKYMRKELKLTRDPFGRKILIKWLKFGIDSRDKLLVQIDYARLKHEKQNDNK
jgi:hypothetical protein